jgi:purine-binding chemotaxis protein CheW
VLDLNRLIGSTEDMNRLHEVDEIAQGTGIQSQRTYSRFVVFSSFGQEYGVPVEQVQEITFLSKIDDVFKNDSIEGAVELRGHSIPVLSATRLLQTVELAHEVDEHTRVLIFDAATFSYGMIVDSVCEIISIADDDVMALPRSGHDTVSGVYERPDGSNIMLLHVDTLIESQIDELQSVSRLKSTREDEVASISSSQSRHLITADCYLVFSIGRNFAIELNDVQEIIEPRDLMTLPAASGFDHRVLNLRGAVVPVINLRAFYCIEEEDAAADKKLIIARSRGRVIALEVDRILTIYKQVQYKQTPSLNPQLNDKKDTLDRLIEFVNESGLKEHVLIINIGAMMANHLAMIPAHQVSDNEIDIKEKDHGNYHPEE